MSDWARIAVGVEEVRACIGVASNVAGPGQQAVQSRLNDETVLCECQCRLEECVPGSPAELCVGRLQHVHQPWYAHRQPAGDGFEERKRRGGSIQEQIRAGPRWGGLAAVQRVDGTGRAVSAHQEAPAANSGRLRFNQREHHLCGDGSVGGRAAFAEDVEGSVHGSRVGGDGHAFVTNRECRRPSRGCGLGFRTLVVVGAGGVANEQEHERGQ